MKHKDAIALVEILTGNRFIQVLAILLAATLVILAAANLVWALSAL